MVAVWFSFLKVTSREALSALQFNLAAFDWRQHFHDFLSLVLSLGVLLNFTIGWRLHVFTIASLAQLALALSRLSLLCTFG